jgi:hypothetical protein
MRNKLLAGLAILTMSFFGAATAGAQEAQPGVARISLIHGDASTQRGDSGDWVAAALNAPVVAGDRVSTGTRSRLELQLDFANILRLDERSEAKLADLTRTHMQVQVARGIVDYSIFKDSEADVEIDTPNVAIHPLGNGRYRVQITADDYSEVIVREGEADITTPQGSTRIHKGQMITIRGLDNPEYQVADAPRNDSWDDWNKNRDHQVQDARSWRHANPYYTGVNDLDPYGHWEYVPDYGDVWVPTVAVGWAPYRYGRWVWEPYWGWTWVSYEPWGWAPYHYGRWFINAGYWCWWPGPVYRAYRPIWAPAYVSFFGFGSHFGFSAGFGFGSIGWLPIGPGDRFFPWWGGHERNISVVNITNITNITNIGGHRGFDPLWNGRGRRFSNLDGVLTDRRLQAGVTTMQRDRFGREAVPRNFQRVSAAEFRQGQMVAGGAPVVPTRESLRPSDRVVNPNSMPARGNRPERFFTRSQQPNRAPESFQSQAAQMQETVRQSERNLGGGRAEMQDAGNRGNGQGGMTRAPAGDARPMPGNRPGAERQAPAQGAPALGRQASEGWRHFGGDRGAGAQQAPGQQRQEQRPQTQAPMTQRPEVQAPGRGNERPAPEGQQGQGGWQRFDRQGQGGPQNAPPSAQRPTESPRPAQPVPQQDRQGWQRFSRQPQQQRPAFVEQPRSMGQQGQAPRGNSRPELNLRQRPILTPRPSPGNENWNRGGRPSWPAPSYRSAPQPSYRSAPQPSYRSAPQPSYRSAPSGGGSRAGSGNRGGGGGSSRGSQGSSRGNRRP